MIPAQLQATLNMIPAYTWYAASSGGLIFVNRRTADYLGLPKDHPLRLGIDVGAQWDAHIPLLHPDDHEETRKVWSTCLRGLELQRTIAQSQHPPIIFISGHGDIPLSVRAMKAGAVDFLTKPVSEEHLLQAINAALIRDRASRHNRAELAKIKCRYASLTPRERQVLPLVVSGLLNKQAAAELGISEVTLQIHRSKVMQKMEARSVVDLVRMAEKLNIPPPTHIT